MMSQSIYILPGFALIENEYEPIVTVPVPTTSRRGLESKFVGFVIDPEAVNVEAVGYGNFVNVAHFARRKPRRKIRGHTHVYHRRNVTRNIIERERLDQYYKDYKALKGNSYIDKYYNRMKKWETVDDNDDDELV